MLATETELAEIPVRSENADGGMLPVLDPVVEGCVEAEVVVVDDDAVELQADPTRATTATAVPATSLRRRQLLFMVPPNFLTEIRRAPVFRRPVGWHRCAHPPPCD